AERSRSLQMLRLPNVLSKPLSASSVHKYSLLTLHRPSNVDHRETFLTILEGLRELSASCPVFFSAHPRTRKRITEFGFEPFFEFKDGKAEANGPKNPSPLKGIYIIAPLGYL